MGLRSRFFNLTSQKTLVHKILSANMPIRAISLSASAAAVSDIEISKTSEKVRYPRLITEAQQRLSSDERQHKATLSNLLSLAQSENARTVGGQRDQLEEEKIDEAVDNLLVKPLSTTLGIPSETALSLVNLVCSIDDQFLDTIDPTASSGLATRLSLLDPHRITVDLCDPLTHVGVQRPSRLVAACPELLLASALSVEPETAHESPVGARPWQRHGERVRRRTVLTEALDELTCLLSRRDVVRLVSRYPNVLMRPRCELTEMYAYLADEMGLQTTEGVVLTRISSYRHAMRHATGLKLVNCPAWSLPLIQVKIRHSLAVLAGLWPRRSNKNWDSESRGDRSLAAILTCPASQVSKHLLPPFDSVGGPVRTKGLLSARDVCCFEAMCARALGRASADGLVDSAPSHLSLYLSPLVESGHGELGEEQEEEEEEVEVEDTLSVSTSPK